MSETIAPTEAQIALASYDRMLAETRKFSAEQNKLAEEAGKLASEARKFNHDRWIVALTAMFTVVGGIIIGLLARLPDILHALGIGQ
jgi:hypothetical protein